MTLATQPLRDEHRELLPELELLKDAGDGIDSPEARELICRGLRFLTAHLIPHAQAEDAALYPVVGRVMGAANATATMSRDHVEVGELTGQLGALRQRAAAGPLDAAGILDVRRVLYGLYALLHVHFAKEEEVYLPLLDKGLSAAEVSEMYERMEAAAAKAKAAAPAH